jgi:prepilin-type N-terminal cleavage/methylation domain-containing protein
MKTNRNFSRATRGFTLVEIMISMTIVVLVLGMCLSTFLFGLRTMYKDNQRLATNASLRSFMAQITQETLDASYFYLFPYYTALDGSVNLTTDPSPVPLAVDTTGTMYDKWIGHGDCLVLITNTSQYRTTDIKQIRIYYRLTTNQTTVNAESPIRYYETADWGEGTASTSNGHTNLTTELNLINLSGNPNLAGSRQLNARSKGRAVAAPFTGYTSGDLYPAFSSESPTASSTNGFISINVEFINGSTINNLLSSSSFNYTISPRR